MKKIEWVNPNDRLPELSKVWFICYINNERTVLMYNAPNQFFVDLTGKTYKPCEIDKWLDA